jgi:hypothetical protein
VSLGTSASFAGLRACDSVKDFEPVTKLVEVPNILTI